MRLLIIVFFISCSKSDLKTIVFNIDPILQSSTTNIVLTNKKSLDSISLTINPDIKNYHMQVKTGLWDLSVSNRTYQMSETLLDINDRSDNYLFQIYLFDDVINLSLIKANHLLISDEFGRIYNINYNGKNMNYITTGQNAIKINSDLIVYRTYSNNRIEIFSKNVNRIINTVEIPNRFRSTFILNDYISEVKQFIGVVSEGRIPYVVIFKNKSSIIEKFEGHSPRFNRSDNQIYFVKKGVIYKKDKNLVIKLLELDYGYFAFNKEYTKFMIIKKDDAIYSFNEFNLSGIEMNKIPISNKSVQRVVNPVYSNDSQFIFFQSVQGDNPVDLYRINSDGSNLKLILKGNFTINASW